MLVTWRRGWLMRKQTMDTDKPYLTGYHRTISNPFEENQTCTVGTTRYLPIYIYIWKIIRVTFKRSNIPISKKVRKRPTNCRRYLVSLQSLFSSWIMDSTGEDLRLYGDIFRRRIGIFNLSADPRSVSNSLESFPQGWTGARSPPVERVSTASNRCTSRGAKQRQNGAAPCVTLIRAIDGTIWWPPSPVSINNASIIEESIDGTILIHRKLEREFRDKVANFFSAFLENRCVIFINNT